MRVAIMQPYFFPYLGYWQLINAADIFVIHDDVQFTKKGWINRNRIIVNEQASYITLPLTKSPNSSLINEKVISPQWLKTRQSVEGKLKQSYGKSKHFNEVINPILASLTEPETNMNLFLKASIKKIAKLLDIETPIMMSSDLDLDKSLRGQDKVIHICQALKATDYINPIGGQGIYAASSFEEKEIELKFLKMDEIYYPQPCQKFISSLSIIDLLFNIGATETKQLLDKHTLI